MLARFALFAVRRPADPHRTSSFLRFNVSYAWGLISGACVHNVT